MSRSLFFLSWIFIIPLAADEPSGILGQFLYFEEGPEDYLVFIDATTGEERDIAGDVDEFTYTFAATGANTASLVATRDVGRYDEWDLTWTGAGQGTFVRREYRDDTLEDTDTGGFVESSGSSAPPSDLSGIRLEESVELEDERFEFLTETDGRKFKPGDIDPFTYTFTPAEGDPAASIVATYRPGRYDEIDLAYEASITGTYILRRFREGLLKDEKRGPFRIALNTQTVDALIGDDKGGLRGDNFFNRTGRSQTATVRLTDDRPVRLRTEIENDGDDDGISARASRGSRKFETRFFSVRPRRNLTAKLTGPGSHLGEFEHEESERIEIETRHRGRGKGRGQGWVQGRSDDTPGAEDRVVFKIKAK